MVDAIGKDFREPVVVTGRDILEDRDALVIASDRFQLAEGEGHATHRLGAVDFRILGLLVESGRAEPLDDGDAIAIFDRNVEDPAGEDRAIRLVQ